MPNFYSDSEKLSLEQQIVCLDQAISRLCDRFDQFESILFLIKDAVEKSAKDSTTVNNDVHVFPMVEVPSGIHVEDEQPVGNINAKSDMATIIGYCGQPEGPGFDNASITTEKGIRSLYEIRITDNAHAYFFPLEDKLLRFRNNASSLLLPVCTIEGDITECQGFTINETEYGQLELDDSGYWKVLKKCIIRCFNRL